MNDNPNPANLDVLPKSTLDLVNMIEAAKADQADQPDTEVTVADVAAAAFVALETVVALMPTPALKAKVIEEFETRAAAYAASMDEA